MSDKEYLKKIKLIKTIKKRGLLDGCGTQHAIESIYMGMSIEDLENILDDEYQSDAENSAKFWGDMASW